MKPYYEHGGIAIYHGDCREALQQLPPCDLVVTSPPYADQRQYGFKKGEFRWDRVVPRALASVNLAPDGQMFVNLGLVHRDGEVVCYWDPMIHTLRSYGYRLFGWYPWDKGCGLMGDWNGRLAPSHEWIFHFNRSVKQPRKIVPCKSVGLKQNGANIRNRDGSAKLKSHAGRDIQPFRIPDSVIRINRHMARGPEMEHPAVFPVALADWLLRAYSDQPDVVLDPFMGSGSTLVASYRLSRRAIGIEIEERYCEIAAKRLQQEVLPLEQLA